MTATEEAIREAAYYRWQEAGEPCGDDLRFWLEAEHECDECHEGTCSDGTESPGDHRVEDASKASFPASDPRVAA